MVAVSSSDEGTDFSLTIKPFEIESGLSPHTFAISSTLILYEGTFAPYPTIPAIKSQPFNNLVLIKIANNCY